MTTVTSWVCTSRCFIKSQSCTDDTTIPTHTHTTHNVAPEFHKRLPPRPSHPLLQVPSCTKLQVGLSPDAHASPGSCRPTRIIQPVLSPGPPEPEPEPERHPTLKDPRLTAGAVGSSPARLTVAGVGGNTAAVHALLRTQGYRGRERGRKNRNRQ